MKTMTSGKTTKSGKSNDRSVIVIVLLLVQTSFPIYAQAPDFQFEGSDPLPTVHINGLEAVIHTQGLFVTKDHYYVTGRLETESKRAFFLRFNRQDLKRYEYIDITPVSTPGTEKTLDHPGGFDFAQGSFWIPVALSKPRGPSVILRIEMRPQEPLTNWSPQIGFLVNDHIGAICYEPATRTLYGANWDTRSVYAWETSGKLKKKIDRDQLVRDNADWQLAVQDWKPAADGFFASPGVIIVGGIDKSPTRPTDASVAVVEFLDLAQQKSLSRVRMPSITGVRRPITNEGLAWHGSLLFLLPEDIGRGAKILRFRMRRGK